MMRRLFELPGIVADYTLGTLIVLVHMAVADRVNNRAPRTLRA